MVLKLQDELSVLGKAKITVTVDYEIYMHFWNIAVQEIERNLGTTITRFRISRKAHKVMDAVFNRIIAASLSTLTPESLGETVKNEVKSEIKDFIPGIT